MTNRLKEPHAVDPRKLSSGRWQARVTYYDPNTGKRRETSQTFATEREAKKMEPGTGDGIPARSEPEAPQ